MNNITTTTITDPYSFFSYNQAVNFVNSLNKCNSDKDCPFNSICISNNCGVTFYCEGDDKCSFYETLCNGKPCNTDSKCKSDSDCLSNICTNNEYLNECAKSRIYSSGIFSFEDGYNYFKKLDKCKVNNDCPNPSSCEGDECIVSFYCKENDNNNCAFEENIKDGIFRFENRVCEANEDCLSGICTDGTCNRNIYALVSRETKIFGLEEGEKCSKDKECASDNCKKGVCGLEKNIEKGLFSLLYMGIGILAIIDIICFLIRTCYRRKKDKKSKKYKNIDEN